jgi:hypothetical protein
LRSYEVRKSIAAKPETVWSLLTDAARFPEWNPAVSRIEGRIGPGETIKVHVPINPARTFPIKVAVFEAPRRMVWRGGMPLGLFTGERTFTLSARDDSTDFEMREVYTGPLAGMMFRQIPDLSGAFEEFGEALKRRAEAIDGGQA